MTLHRPAHRKNPYKKECHISSEVSLKNSESYRSKLNHSEMGTDMKQNRFTGCLLLLTTLIAISRPSNADEQIYSQTLKSTAWVLAKTEGSTSSGTGVLVDAERRLLVTNFHIVGDARAAVIFFPEREGSQVINDRDHYLKNVRNLGIRGQVVGIDRKRDLALVQLARLPENVDAITLASTSASPGAVIQSIGNSGSSDALWVFTSGTVRSVYQKQFRTGSGEHDFRVIESQSPINPGDSGGPVVNSSGELIGIAQSISPKARLVSYNVDISEVRAFLDSDWKPAPRPIEDVLAKTQLEFSKHESGHFQVSVSQQSGAEQIVFVTKEIEYFERTDVRRVWSLAAVLDQAPTAATMLRLMQQSSRTKLGAWTLEKNEAGQYLMIYCSKVDATATPDALQSTMEYVARLARMAKPDLTPAVTEESPSETLSSWLAK